MPVINAWKFTFIVWHKNLTKILKGQAMDLKYDFRDNFEVQYQYTSFSIIMHTAVMPLSCTQPSVGMAGTLPSNLTKNFILRVENSILSKDQCIFTGNS